MLKTVSNGQSIHQYIPPHLRRMFYNNPAAVHASQQGKDPYGFSTDGLVAYIPLWALRGSGFQSVDAYRHICTPSGVILGDNGGYFDGTDDEIVITANSSLSFTTGDFSIIVWSYLEDIGTHRVMVGGSSLDAPALYSRSNEAILLAKPSTANAPAANTAMPEDTWSCVGLSFDNSEAVNNLQYYFNGATDGLVSFDQDFADYLNQIGSTVDQNFWKGYIGEALIYNRILTAGEFSQHYECTKWRY